MAGINLTPLRIECLRLIAERPGIYLGALAEKLAPRRSWTDASKTYPWSAQGATRWGGGYAAPLVRAGLVRRDPFVDCGGARLYITDAGRAVLDRGEPDPV